MLAHQKSSKSRWPRWAGGILAQYLSLVNRASSLCTSQWHDPRPSSFWRRFGPIFEPGQQGLLTLHFRVPWSPRCHRFEEVSFFRVSFHSFRQKRDSPSEWVQRRSEINPMIQPGPKSPTTCPKLYASPTFWHNFHCSVKVTSYYCFFLASKNGYFHLVYDHMNFDAILKKNSNTKICPHLQ